MARYKVNDHYRSVYRTERHVSDPDLAVTVANISNFGLRIAVRESMDDLSEQYRTALELKYVSKLTVREIAENLKLTEKAVESILFRARRAFRRGFSIR